MLVTTTPTIEGGRITRVGEVALMKKCCAKLKI